MNLKEFVQNLVTLLDDNPELGDLIVVTAKDDEGNGFNEVWNESSIGFYDGEYNGDFTYEEDFEDREIDESPNAICVN